MENKNTKIEPVVSEKSYALANTLNKYVFMVPLRMSRIEVGKKVASKYKVSVVKVNTVIKPGKLKRDWKVGKLYRKSDKKKAIVTLKDGDKISDFFNK